MEKYRLKMLLLLLPPMLLPKKNRHVSVIIVLHIHVI